MIRCTAHPSEVAGWRCPKCLRELCVACAAVTGNQVVVCAGCGTLADEHRVPRAEVFPFTQVWPRALRELRSVPAIFQGVVFATAAHFFFTFGRSLWVAGCVLTVAWVLILARRAAIGIGCFGTPTWHDLQVVGTGSLLRFACAAWPIGLGAMGWTRLGRADRSLASPWPWLLAAAALVAVPPALAIATVEGQGSTIVWPWRLGHWLRTLGAELRPLQLATGIAVALALYSSRLPAIDRNLEDTHLLAHLVESWVPRLLFFGALGALGALTGALVFTRASELGHGMPEDDRVPRVSARPTGHYERPAEAVEAEAQARARKFEPIAIDES